MNSILPMPTPCVGVCKLDEATQLCLGCARTADEIAGWRDATPDAQRIVWAALPERRSLMGMQGYRLPWRADQIGQFIETSIAKRAGVWTLGVYGGVGEFMIGAGETIDIVSDSEVVVARTQRGALRLLKHPKSVAFAISHIPGQPVPRAIGLALPRNRVALPGCSGLIRIGPDAEALNARDSDSILYDFGLGRKAARFCIRSNDPALEKALDAMLGAPLRDLLNGVGQEILRCAPDRVIETGLGRAEIFSRIPATGGVSPDGPYTHLLPNLLDMRRDTPPDWDLDQVFAPAAILYLYPGVKIADFWPWAE